LLCERSDHVACHLSEASERLVGVALASQIDLAHPCKPDSPPNVHQHRDLDSVSGEEGDLLEQRESAGNLAGERLPEGRQIRHQQLEQRPRGQLRNPAPAVFDFGSGDRKWPPVKALDEVDFR